MHTQHILKQHPNPLDLAGLTECLNDCLDCFQSCTSCADACLAEDNVAEMRRCIRLCLDCADLCRSTASILSRQTEPTMSTVAAAVEALRQACADCGSLCEQHADKMAHCKTCAESCRTCEKSCASLLEHLGAHA